MFTHTYLRCNMEPELYDYENAHADSYEQDNWYQQSSYKGDPVEDKVQEYIGGYDEDDEYDMDELPYDYMSEYDDDFYEPEREY